MVHHSAAIDKKADAHVLCITGAVKIQNHRTPVRVLEVRDLEVGITCLALKRVTDCVIRTQPLPPGRALGPEFPPACRIPMDGPGSRKLRSRCMVGVRS
jgi:hypothetical protein